MQLQSYEEWVLSAGMSNELGAKILITYSILRDAHKGVIDSAFNATKATFERVLFESGSIPQSIEYIKEDDAFLRAREITTLVCTYQGASLQEFAPVVYAQARDFYNQVEIWKGMSLWGYIKHWIKR